MKLNVAKNIPKNSIRFMFLMVIEEKSRGRIGENTRIKIAPTE